MKIPLLTRKYILIVIIVIAVFLRFSSLGVNPPGVHADEADSGYNAYSILKTGRDFYGNFLPIQIVGFAENFRTPLSTYLTIPFIAIFGLSPFVIRLPAALLGVLFVILMYLLIKNLFQSEKAALLGAFLSAVNPWAVYISRAYADHILALDFVLLGVVLLLTKRKAYLPFAVGGLAFGLSFFSYHAPKIFLLLFTPLLVWYITKSFKKQWRYLLAFFVPLFLCGLLVAYISLFHAGGREFNNVSVFNKDMAVKIVDRERRVTYAHLKISSFFHNKPLYYAKEFFRNYTKGLSVLYLYVDGESNLTAWVGQKGLFFPIELPFLLIGLYYFFRTRPRLGVLVLGWILLSVIPGAVTNNQMFTYRNINLLPPIILTTSFGAISAWDFIKKKWFHWLVAICVVFLFIGNAASFYFQYFFDYPAYSRNWWATEQREALEYAEKNKDKYKYVFVNGGRDWPLLYAFYNRVDPALFQNAINNLVTQNNEKYLKIGKFYFGTLYLKPKDTPESKFPKNSLYVGSHDHFDTSKVLHRVISFEDWGTVYKMIEVQ